MGIQETLYSAIEHGDVCHEVIGNSPGEPRIPSFCAGDETCQQCYHDVRTNFDNVRAKLEKLRIIYACSSKITLLKITSH